MISDPCLAVALAAPYVPAVAPAMAAMDRSPPLPIPPVAAPAAIAPAISVHSNTVMARLAPTSVPSR